MAEQIPQLDALPSIRTLIRSTMIAAVVAATLLVTIVLPAEYGIDPTGVGRLLGLTDMGEIKMSLENEAQRAPATTPAPCPPATSTAAADPRTVTPNPMVGSAAPVAAAQDHVTHVSLKPGEAKEVKLSMREGAKVTFSWSTDTGVVNYDLHSDNPTKGTYHGYGKGSGVRTHEGTLVAAFDGMHGWYWRNRTKEVVTITLKTNGDYQEIKELQ